MTEAPYPASAWWSALAPEARRFWFQHITGWTMEGAVKAAYERAMGEKTPGDAIALSLAAEAAKHAEETKQEGTVTNG